MAENFIWREISEKEKEDIRKQAKNILGNFSEKLAKIDHKKINLEENEINEFERTESGEEKSDADFRKIMFENAPEKNKNFIIAEKKKW